MKGWTVDAIDRAIPIIQAKVDRARANGRPDHAARHQKWLDLLIEARPFHVEQESPGPPIRPCPECRDGKHGNCDGYAWNLETDELAACPCSKAGHKP